MGRRKTFVVEKFDLGVGDMKVTTINIRSVKIHTTETPCPTTGVDGGDRDAATTTTTIRDTHVTYPVYVQLFKAPAPKPLNDEAFRLMVTQTMDKTPGLNRWVLPVLCYPRNMFIYHYPLIGVILMVILLIFIIQNYPNFFSNDYPKYTIWVIYPFIFNLRKF